MTLGLVYNHPNILLGMKKIGFGKDRWNGFGGKLEKGEGLEEGLIREAEEEFGIKPIKFEKQGIIYFQFENDPDILEVNIFKIFKYEDEPTETEEMKPQWFDVNNLLWKDMWSDDPIWYPLFLEGKKFEGNILFNDQHEVIQH